MGFVLEHEFLKWIGLLVFGTLFFFISPWAKTNATFFRANKNNVSPKFWILTSSLIISWIFAKSITNVANLGMAFGLVGSFAYAVYYFSFITAGIIIYKIRTQLKFESISAFLTHKFGKTALRIFAILIVFRLFNEVWSNTMVVGSYFGESGSKEYYISILLFTLLTLAYALKGGLSSSLQTDFIQFILWGFFLIAILGLILPTREHTFTDYMQTGEWKMDQGLNLVFAALIQIFSYPFHDPVLTDRGFISSPKTTLTSFLWAGIIGFIAMIVFGLIGVFGNLTGLTGQAAVEVGFFIGGPLLLFINFIMITSAASTLDSTFASFSKLITIDLFPHKKASITKGRLLMIALAIIGTMPVFMNPEILSATTISGTMVIGLTPVFLLYNYSFPPSSFYLSVGFGIFIGILLATNLFPEGLIYTSGKYAALLWANFWGIIGCFILYFTPKLWTSKT